MALQASTVWEVRSAGNNNNGGGYTSGGTDYSQQDAAQQSWTNLSSSGANLIDDDAGGNFTAAMVGNIINLIGYGRFEITAYINGNTVTLDSGPGLSGGDTGYVGGAVADLEQIDNVIVAGNTIHVKAGTYVAGGSLSFTAGQSTTPVIVTGYNSSRGDNPTGTNRPLLTMGANAITAGTYTQFRNFRMTSSAATFFTLGTGSVMENCAVDHSGAGDAIVAGQSSFVVDCDITSNGTGIDCTGYGVRIHGCYIHDLATGIEFDQYACSVEFCILDTCSSIGVYINGANARHSQDILNNVFYACADGVYAALAIFGNKIMNNSFTDGTDGIHVTTSSPHNHIDYNNFYNNGGNDVTNVSKGPSAAANDPKFTNAAAGDFSLQVDSAMIGAGFAVRVGV